MPDGSTRPTHNQLRVIDYRLSFLRTLTVDPIEENLHRLVSHFGDGLLDRRQIDRL